MTNYPVEICHDLGVFSSIELAKEKINNTKDLPGYNKYDSKCFKVIKRCVLCDEYVDKQKIKTLYLLYSEIERDGYTEWRDYGLYYYKSLANRDLKWITKHSSYGKKNKNSFIIIKVKINIKTYWSKGFDLL